MDKRSTMLAMYLSNPDGLAVDLEILFEPCTDASFAVLHNAALDKIIDLCGKDVEEKDELGISKGKIRVFDCKANLAQHLAKMVLMYARQTK